jgi:hypothetical protein
MGTDIGAKQPRGLLIWLGVFLLLLTYDGALRKWAFPGIEELLFVAKDGVLLLLLSFVLLTQQGAKNRRVPSAIRIIFALYASWVLVEALNPSLPNLAVGLWGIKAHLLYACLIILLPAVFVDLNQLFTVLGRVYPWITIPVCGLAILQLAWPADNFLNQNVRGGIESVATFGTSDLVRVAGPFSYLSGMAAFVQFASLFGAGLYLAGARSKLFLAGFAATVIALPATGSRSVIAIAGAGAIILFCVGFVGRVISPKVLLRSAAVGLALLYLSFAMQDDAWQALQARFEVDSEEGTSRAISAFTGAFDYFDVAGIGGYGSGAANLGAVALVNISDPFSWLPTQREEECIRIVLELGVLGWILSMSLRIAMLVWCLQLAFGGTTRLSRVAAVTALPFMALGVYQGNGVFAASYMAVAYWFAVALLAMAQYEHDVTRPSVVWAGARQRQVSA